MDRGANPLASVGMSGSKALSSSSVWDSALAEPGQVLPLCRAASQLRMGRMRRAVSRLKRLDLFVI